MIFRTVVHILLQFPTYDTNSSNILKVTILFRNENKYPQNICSSQSHLNEISGYESSQKRIKMDFKNYLRTYFQKTILSDAQIWSNQMI